MEVAGNTEDGEEEDTNRPYTDLRGSKIKRLRTNREKILRKIRRNKDHSINREASKAVEGNHNTNRKPMGTHNESLIRRELVGLNTSRNQVVRQGNTFRNSRSSKNIDKKVIPRIKVHPGMSHSIKRRRVRRTPRICGLRAIKDTKM